MTKMGFFIKCIRDCSENPFVVAEVVEALETPKTQTKDWNEKPDPTKEGYAQIILTTSSFLLKIKYISTTLILYL
jgi:hypothetical protein